MSHLTASEVCEIIKVCAASGVARIQYGALEVDFGSQSVAAEPQPHVVEESVISQVEQEAVLSAEVNAKQEELSSMLLTDPSEYERLMLLGDLEDKAEPDAE